MKTRITILAIILAIFGTISAYTLEEATNSTHEIKQLPEQEYNLQNPRMLKDMNLIVDEKTRFLKRGNEILSNPDYLVDSVKVYETDGDEYQYTYTYNENNNSRTTLRCKVIDNQMNNDNKIIDTYDENGKMLTKLAQNWVDENWENSTKFEQTYDKYGNILLSLQHNWQNNNWEIIHRNEWEYEYDLNGNILIVTRKGLQNNESVYFGKESNTYDYNSNVLSNIYQKWNNDEWINVYKYTYSYGETSKLLIDSQYEIWKNDKWITMSRVTNSYSQTGNILISLYQEWNNSIITYKEKNSYHYNNDDKLLSDYIIEVWENDIWFNSLKNSYTYTNNGYLLTDSIAMWKNDKWLYFNRNSYSYDKNDNLLSKLYEGWENDNWIFISKWNNSYDPNSNLIIASFYSWKDEKWQIVTDFSWDIINNFLCSKNYHNIYTAYKLEITWIKSTTSVENEYSNNPIITTFPNPFSNSTIIEYNIEEPAFVSINIYDGIGNKIATLVNENKDIGEHQAIFIAEDYPQGMYYYTIQIGANFENGKLLLVK